MAIMRRWLPPLVLLLLPALAAGQSLADLARKEKERREKRPRSETARTLTEEDLEAADGSLANDPGEAFGPKAEPGRAGSDRPPALTLRPAERARPAAEDSETYWRGRAAATRARIEKARQVYDRYDYMIRIGQPMQQGEDGRWRGSSPQTLKRRADAAQQELRNAEQALADLQTEARRAGAPPGWLRE
jgi:hypothetical protein